MGNLLVFIIIAAFNCRFAWAEEESFFEYGGSLQLKAGGLDVSNAYGERKFLADIRRLHLDGVINFSEKIYGEITFHADTWHNYIGLDECFLQWHAGRLFVFRVGSFRKPFSMEELTPTTLLWTIEKSRLYNRLLVRQNGYAGFDAGLEIAGHSPKKIMGFQLGLFKGVPRKNGYINKNSDEIERDFSIWDAALRLTFVPLSHTLLLEVSGTIRSVKDTARSFLKTAIDPAIQAGFRWLGAAIRFQGEVSAGGNHRGSDLEVLESHPYFLAFYLMPVYIMPLPNEKKLEWVFRWEGQDPGWSSKDSVGYKNDASFFYTVGASYFFKTWINFQLNYGFRQPVTRIAAQSKLHHILEFMVRMEL